MRPPFPSSRSCGIYKRRLMLLYRSYFVSQILTLSCHATRVLHPREWSYLTWEAPTVPVCWCGRCGSRPTIASTAEVQLRTFEGHTWFGSDFLADLAGNDLLKAQEQQPRVGEGRAQLMAAYMRRAQGSGNGPWEHCRNVAPVNLCRYVG